MFYKNFLYKLLAVFSPNFNRELVNLVCHQSNITIFDIGFYTGNYSKELINGIKKQNKNTDINIYSFEPNIFVNNIDFKNFSEKNKINWKHFTKAIGNENSKKEFTILENFPPSGSSLNNILIDSFWLRTRKFLFSPLKINKVSLKVIEVNVKKLDTLFPSLNKLDILKVDVEGYALEVLKGSKQIIENLKPIIQVEILSKKKDFFNQEASLKDLMSEFGYIEANRKKHYTTHLLSDIICVDYLFKSNTKI